MYELVIVLYPFFTTCWLNKQIEAKTDYKPFLMLIKLVNLSLIKSLVLCIKGL